MSFIEELKDATIGFSGYARLARGSRSPMRYLVILLAIVVAINGYINYVRIRNITAATLPVVQQMPDFRLQDGRFEFDGPVPYETRALGMRFIIDTTGQTGPEALGSEAGFLITADHYYMTRPGVPAQAIDLSLIRGRLTRDDLILFLESGPQRMIPFAYGIIFVFQVGIKSLDAAILAGVTTLSTRSNRRPVPFRLAYRLAIYAMSLPIIIQWIWPNFSTLSIGGFAIWWGLTTTYLAFGLRAYLHGDAQEA